MWQRKESPIARGFLAVDLHLSEERGGGVARSGSPDASSSRLLSARSYNSRD